MITEKERIVSNENYEISKKLFDLFKKYKNYDSNMKKQNLQNIQPTGKYNPDDLFKNKKSNNVENEVKELALVETKKEKWYEKIFSFIKKIFKH